MTDVSLLVHGEDWPSSSGAVFERSNPLSGEVVTRAQAGTPDDAVAAVEAAAAAFPGICHVNGPAVHDEAQMPFGGVKASGIGRFGGRAGVHEFTDLRWLTVQTSPRHYPF
jgi:acyl-CoA reductase-like NAD-dependent aldehyde dehydrogenase